MPVDEGAQSEAILPAEQPCQEEEEGWIEKKWQKERGKGEEKKLHSKKAGTVHEKSCNREGI